MMLGMIGMLRKAFYNRNYSNLSILDPREPVLSRLTITTKLGIAGFPMKERKRPEPLDFNQIASLPQEKQSTAVLQYLTDCESFLTSSTGDEISQHQEPFRQVFLDFLALPSPPIAHVLRNCLGRCFSSLFERGDRRILFETVSTLLQKTTQLRGDKEAKQKQYHSILSK
jgi:hypothetical protein